MPHVTGIATITIDADRRRTVTTRDLQVNPAPKPLTLEASGSDPVIWKRILAGEVGTFETLVHVGRATGLLVPRRAIALPYPSFPDQMVANFGELGDYALLGAVRTGSAAATQFCVDMTGMMFTTLDWEFETLSAMLKILVFRDDGWVRILLPAGLADYQEAFDEQQRRRWQVVRPGFAQKYETRLTFVPTGNDRFNGESTLVGLGPLGDLQPIRVARLNLEGEGYRFCDGEWRSGQRVINQRRPESEEELVPALWPLNRQIVAITTVADLGVPLILQLHPDGHLHQGGLHVFVDGLNDRLLSHNTARVVSKRGLNWVK